MLSVIEEKILNSKLSIIEEIIQVQNIAEYIEYNIFYNTNCFNTFLMTDRYTL